VLSGHTKQIEQSFKVENIFEAPKTPGARSTPQAIVADGVGIQVFSPRRSVGDSAPTATQIWLWAVGKGLCNLLNLQK
jgi:hypothetical protein